MTATAKKARSALARSQKQKKRDNYGKKICGASARYGKKSEVSNTFYGNEASKLAFIGNQRINTQFANQLTHLIPIRWGGG